MTEIVTAGFGDASPEFCAACHRITAGNPFYLRELLDAVTRLGIAATADGARQLDSLGPANVAAAVLARMRQHGDRAEAVARALAVLDADASLRGAAELAGVGEAGAATELIDQLVSAQILSAERTLPVRPSDRPHGGLSVDPAGRAVAAARRRGRAAGRRRSAARPARPPPADDRAGRRSSGDGHAAGRRRRGPDPRRPRPGGALPGAGTGRGRARARAGTDHPRSRAGPAGRPRPGLVRASARGDRADLGDRTAGGVVAGADPGAGGGRPSGRGGAVRHRGAGGRDRGHSGGGADRERAAARWPG